MAAKKKKKPVSKKRKSELAKLIKKFPKTKKALKKTAILGAAPAFYGYQGAKGKDVDLGSLLGTLDLTDPMLRNLWGNLIKKEAGEAKEEYFGKDSNWKDKVQLAADIGGTIWDFSPFGFLTDSDIGYGSKKLGAGTLDSPSSKKRPVQKTAKLEDLSPSQLRQYRNTLGGFGNITEERRKINELLKGKKKGGKVIKSKTKKNKKSGRPKGVGCATRGYGKAMKRGK